MHTLGDAAKAAFKSRYDKDVHFVEIRVIITDTSKRAEDAKVYLDATKAIISSCDLQMCSACDIFEYNELELCGCKFCEPCVVAQLTFANRNSDADAHMGPQGTNQCPVCEQQSTEFRQMYDANLSEQLARSLQSARAKNIAL